MFFIIIIIIILLLQFWGVCFLFFVLHFDKLVNIAYENVPFGSFYFCHLLYDNIWQWQLNNCFLKLRFNPWFVNFDCISKSLNVEWKPIFPTDWYGLIMYTCILKTAIKKWKFLSPIVFCNLHFSGELVLTSNRILSCHVIQL